jgi:hypothetical protein
MQPAFSAIGQRLTPDVFQGLKYWIPVKYPNFEFLDVLASDSIDNSFMLNPPV